MKEINTNLKALNEIFRNANAGLNSISYVLDEITDKEFRDEILKEYSGYESVLKEITEYMKEKGSKIEDVGAFKKCMMKMGIKMNTMFDNSTSHIAELMIKGTVAGICEIKRILNANNVSDEKTVELCQKLYSLEEEYENSLKKFL